MSRTAVYARISSDRTGEGLGVQRQVADCEQLAERKGWEVVERYIDDDLSAYSGRERPAYRQLLADLRAGVIDSVVVWHLDRLHRRPKELEEFFELCAETGVTSLASVTGDVDLGTYDGQFMARILGAVSRKSDDKSRRAKRKALELAQAGRRSGGGTRGYGYEADGCTVRPTEAAVIRDCATRFLAGESIGSLCKGLEESQVAAVRERRGVRRSFDGCSCRGASAGSRSTTARSSPTVTGPRLSPRLRRAGFERSWKIRRGARIGALAATC
ncbi:MAG: recombinase family protein [Thermoleophilaceae bacterium]